MVIKDGYIPIDVLNRCIESAESAKNYKSLHPAAEDAFGFKFSWHMYSLGENINEMPDEFMELWDSCKNLFPDGSLLHRCYVNAHCYGIEDTIHEDDKHFKNGLTCIVYLCNAWYPEWFGQTVFWEHLDRTAPNDITHSVMPKYNRVLVFDKKTPHCVAPLSRRFSGVRYTCMFKVQTL